MNKKIHIDLFDNNRFNCGQFPIYFYLYIWEILEKRGIIKEETDADKIDSFLYACVIVDLYRKFETIHNQENWDIEDGLTYPNDPIYSYNNLCERLEIDPISIDEYCTQDELLEFSQKDIECILKENQPSFAELFVTDIRHRYRSRLFNTLKEALSASELFAAMANASSNDYYENILYSEHCDNYDESDDEYEFFSINSLDDFKQSIDRHKQNILNDFEVDKIRAFEWLVSIY